jgi:hypothetical protein
MLFAALVLAGCGGQSKSTAEIVADCLNEQGFLVQASDTTVSGSSPGGINFTVTFEDGKPVIDDSGNPGGPGQGLSDQERTKIELCIPGS